MFAWFLVGEVKGADCGLGVLNVTVSTSDDAKELAEALTCTGSVHIVVNWLGRVELTQTVVVGNSSTLDIVGSEKAIIDGNRGIPLIKVSGGASLNLFNISLEDGEASDWGGAVFANESSITLDSCHFSGNNATYSGGK